MNVVSLHVATNETGPIQLLGKLLAPRADGQFEVEGEKGATWLCRRAASCLLRPEVGDTVLLSGPDRFRLFLIAVIEQVDPRASCIEASGDLTLSSIGKGTVSIQSDSTLLLHGARTLELRAEQAKCTVDEMQFTAKSADATVGHLRIIGKILESVTDRIFQMTRTALRLVDEVDQVRAGHLDHEAQDTVRIHGQHTVVTGKDLVKVDAAQIHMG
ncbi:MAG: DUF3540 domain-containing protein [Variovorax sp.]|nr:MAG: DUF3540 domain-containing protein [Variovorax sp.]